jgi:hypothetical protein
LHNLDLNDSTDILDPVAFIVPMLDACRWMLDTKGSGVKVWGSALRAWGFDPTGKIQGARHLIFFYR